MLEFIFCGLGCGFCASVGFCFFGGFGVALLFSHGGISLIGELYGYGVGCDCVEVYVDVAVVFEYVSDGCVWEVSVDCRSEVEYWWCVGDYAVDVFVILGEVEFGLWVCFPVALECLWVGVMVFHLRILLAM